MISAPTTSYMFSDAFQDLLPVLDQTAAQRDRAGGHAVAEKALLRDADLLRLAIPARFGGHGLPWPEVYRYVRALARVDSALAHVFAFHHLQVATVLIYGRPAQQAHWLPRTVEERGWWGNALNPRDTRLKALPAADGYVLDGSKGFCSGTRGSSYMTVSGCVDGATQPVLGVLESTAPGITVHEDWNPMGQRQTDSGSVSFAQTGLPAHQIMRDVHEPTTAWHSLRTCMAQLVLVNLFVGIAQGAQHKARDYALASVKPWVTSPAERATDDPYLLRRMGDIQAQTSAASLMADHAANLLQKAWLKGEALTAEDRAEVAIAVFEAKVIAHRTSLFTTQEIFDVVGARGTHADLGFDRFWRNARTHTLHDPLDYKLQVLGQWAVYEQAPSGANYN